MLVIKFIAVPLDTESVTLTLNALLYTVLPLMNHNTDCIGRKADHIILQLWPPLILHSIYCGTHEHGKSNSEQNFFYCVMYPALLYYMYLHKCIHFKQDTFNPLDWKSQSLSIILLITTNLNVFSADKVSPLSSKIAQLPEQDYIQILHFHSKEILQHSILSFKSNNSPDLPFNFALLLWCCCYGMLSAVLLLCYDNTCIISISKKT